MPTPRKRDAEGKIILNERERLLVAGITAGKTYTQAAIDAGYSKEYAGTIGKDYHKKPHIITAIQQRVYDVIEADVPEVLGVLASHLRADLADLADFFNKDGSLDLKSAQRAGVSRTIKKYKTRRSPVLVAGEGKDRDMATAYEVTTEIELHDSQAAARSLADIMGIKQMPRVNDADKARDKEMIATIQAEVERLVKAGWSESDAKAIVLEAEPTASQWIQ